MSEPLKTPRSKTAMRVAAYRKRMRAAGLVPKTIWVPNIKDPAFLAELDRQCQIIASSKEEREIMDWIEALQSELDLGPEYPQLGQK